MPTYWENSNFHDESIFTANEDQRLQWGSTDMHVIHPKGKGSGIMVSNFIDERDEYFIYLFIYLFIK